MMQSLLQSLMQGLMQSIFSDSGNNAVSEQERQRQLRLLRERELARQKEVEQLLQDLKGVSSVKLELKTNKDTDLSLKGITSDKLALKGTERGDGLKLKTDLQTAQTARNTTGVYSGFFGQPVADQKTVGLLREPTVSEKDFDEARYILLRIHELQNKGALSVTESAELTALKARRTLIWTKAISNTDLTQEERERLALKMKVRPAVLADYPMVDGRALVEKERYTDVYLDIATAAVQAEATTLSVGLVEEGGRKVLRTFSGRDKGYDTVLSAGKAVVEKPTTAADKTIAVVDYALTFIPESYSKLVLPVDVALNAVGAGTRQALVRYWAWKDSRQYFDPTPIKTAKEKWNFWYADQCNWTQKALNRVSAGEFD